MTPLDVEIIAARAQADQGHQFFSAYLDNLITEYRTYGLTAGGDRQDMRSVWMKNMASDLEYGEALALLTIALDRAAFPEDR